MATFIIGLFILFAGGALYGRMCEKVFGAVLLLSAMGVFAMLLVKGHPLLNVWWVMHHTTGDINN